MLLCFSGVLLAGCGTEINLITPSSIELRLSYVVVKFCYVCLCIFFNSLASFSAEDFQYLSLHMLLGLTVYVNPCMIKYCYI